MVARQRFIITILLSSLLVLIIGYVRPPEGEGNTGVYREAFWRSKIKWTAQFDVVLAGDSRTLCDLSPSSMREVLPSHLIANFGFNYVGLTPEYLAAVEAKLDPARPDKMIVLGITPRSLTPLNERVSGYVEEKNRSVDENVVASYFAPMVSFFRPISIVSAKRWLLREQSGYKDFYPDGWMSVRLVPPNPKADLPFYERVFTNNQVSPRLTDELLTTVRHWREKGIRVFAFRPPAAPEIVEVENTQSGFDEASFSRRFTEAGGTWLTIDATGYEITDGSHLSADSARGFSRRLAASLK